MHDITINKVVIHELVKEQHAQIKPPNLRPTTLDHGNATVAKLVDGISKLYGTRNNSLHYGTFLPNKDFPSKFINYAGSPLPTNDHFLELSITAMTTLCDAAQLTSASSGGYILFADYSNAQTRFFIAAMIKQKEGMRLSANLEPEELVQLDLSRLHQAARINFGKLSAFLAADDKAREEKSYLSFISPAAGKAASGYFVTALGCSAGAASTRATDNVVRESVAFFKSNELLKASRNLFKEELVAYLKKKAKDKESARLSEIEVIARRYVPAESVEEADKLIDMYIAHLNSEENSVPVEFPVNPTVLRKHTQIKGNSDNWDLKFDRNSLGTNDAAQIYYNKEENSITIKNIPDTMIELIDEELESRKLE